MDNTAPAGAGIQTTNLARPPAASTPATADAHLHRADRPGLGPERLERRLAGDPRAPHQLGHNDLIDFYHTAETQLNLVLSQADLVLGGNFTTGDDPLQRHDDRRAAPRSGSRSARGSRARLALTTAAVGHDDLEAVDRRDRPRRQRRALDPGHRVRHARPGLLMRTVATLIASLGMALAAFGLAVAAPLDRHRDTAQMRLLAASGALGISNSSEGQAVFSASGARPGPAGRRDVRIGNSGAAAASFSVRLDALHETPGTYGGRLSEQLALVLLDITDPQRPATLYAGTPAALPRSRSASSPPASNATTGSPPRCPRPASPSLRSPATTASRAQTVVRPQLARRRAGADAHPHPDRHPGPARPLPALSRRPRRPRRGPTRPTVSPASQPYRRCARRRARPAVQPPLREAPPAEDPPPGAGRRTRALATVRVGKRRIAVKRPAPRDRAAPAPGAALHRAGQAAGVERPHVQDEAHLQGLSRAPARPGPRSVSRTPSTGAISPRSAYPRACAAPRSAASCSWSSLRASSRADPVAAHRLGRR